MPQMMKTRLALMGGLALLLCSCRAYPPVEQASGSEDIAYLLFVSPGQNAGQTVTVKVSGQWPFDAKVVKSKKANRKGKAYAVPTGRRRISVTRDDKTLYEKEIFVSPQETKTILLP